MPAVEVFVPAESLAPVEFVVPDGIGPIADVAGLKAENTPVWLVLSRDGVLSRWNPDSAEVVALASVPVVAEVRKRVPKKIRRRLHAPRCGRFAAIVDDYGSSGSCH